MAYQAFATASTVAALRRGLLRRLAGRDEAAALALRGGVRIRSLAGDVPRRVEDLDLAWDVRWDEDAVRGALCAALDDEAVADGVRFDPELRRIDAYHRESAFRGLRLRAVGTGPEGIAEVVADVVHVDLWPAPRWVLEGPCLRGVAPSTIVATKLRVMSELGPRRWRPKDLADVIVLLRRHASPVLELGEAVERAWAQGRPRLEDPRELLRTPSWWRDPRRARAWMDHAGANPGQALSALGPTVAELGEHLAPLWRRRP